MRPSNLSRKTCNSLILPSRTNFPSSFALYSSRRPLQTSSPAAAPSLYYSKTIDLVKIRGQRNPRTVWVPLKNQLNSVELACSFDGLHSIKNTHLFSEKHDDNFFVNHISVPTTARLLTPFALKLFRRLGSLEPASKARNILLTGLEDRWFLRFSSQSEESRPPSFNFTLPAHHTNAGWATQGLEGESKNAVRIKGISLGGQVAPTEDTPISQSIETAQLLDRPFDELAEKLVYRAYSFISDHYQSYDQETLAAKLNDYLVDLFNIYRHDLVATRASVVLDFDDSIDIQCTTDFGLQDIPYSRINMLNLNEKSRFFIALGSNLGNRVAMIEQACKEMEDAGLRIVRTSGLWETKPMYVEDQDNFINGVCEIESTYMDPNMLLSKLQHIENKMGRVKLIDKGPRCIDLDILLWDYQTWDTTRDPNFVGQPLIIPHKLMLEREFVLRPLCELIPNEALPPSLPRGTFDEHLKTLVHNNSQKVGIQKPLPMSTHVPISPNFPPLLPINPSRKTQIMSIINLTPDSFSDGGLHNPEDLPVLKETIDSHLSSGSTIIDIGGQSSRPGAPSITAEEELSRILPAISLLKKIEHSNSGKYPPFSISVDTYRATVAAEAIKAGAYIINDVSAGTMDPDMLPTVAKLGCTYVLMHMRGTPETMNNSEYTTYNGDLIKIIGAELLTRVHAAETSGIRRWRIILDPGIGFAKTGAQNLEILRRFDELRDYPGLRGMPWLLGVSRKGFVGEATGVRKAKARGWGTAAAVTAAVRGGADIVRVHDTWQMRQVVGMADAIWRGEWGEEGKRVTATATASSSSSGGGGSGGSGEESESRKL